MGAFENTIIIIAVLGFMFTISGLTDGNTFSCLTTTMFNLQDYLGCSAFASILDFLLIFGAGFGIIATFLTPTSLVTAVKSAFAIAVIKFFIMDMIVIYNILSNSVGTTFAQGIIGTIVIMMIIGVVRWWEGSG